MENILVVYYSRTGYTRRTAAALSRECDADMDEIHLAQHRPGGRAYLHCAFEAIAKRAAPIRPAHRDPRLSELVVIGTPVWCGNMASPVRSYLQAHHDDLKNVAFFSTMRGRDAERVFRNMAALCAKAPVATLALRDVEIDTQPGSKLVEFSKTLMRSQA